jgi:hypothetical protein
MSFIQQLDNIVAITKELAKEHEARLEDIKRYADCDHIVGLSDAGYEGMSIRWVSSLEQFPNLHEDGGDYIFKYCPICGCKLEGEDLLELKKLKDANKKA